MGLQSTEGENDGMTTWFEEHYAGDGFKASRISDNRTRLRLPKQADNIGELITRAYEEHGAICDLSLGADGRSELTFWSVPREEESSLQKVSGYTWAARISAAVAAILFLMAVVELFFLSQV